MSFSVHVSAEAQSSALKYFESKARDPFAATLNPTGGARVSLRGGKPGNRGGRRVQIIAEDRRAAIVSKRRARWTIEDIASHLHVAKKTVIETLRAAQLGGPI